MFDITFVNIAHNSGRLAWFGNSEQKLQVKYMYSDKLPNVNSHKMFELTAVNMEHGCGAWGNKSSIIIWLAFWKLQPTIKTPGLRYEIKM